MQLVRVGIITATPGALRLLRIEGKEPADLLDRHVMGDWGDLGLEDSLANFEALTNGTRVLSSYKLNAQGDAVWIITEADRSSTTLLLPGEY